MESRFDLLQLNNFINTNGHTKQDCLIAACDEVGRGPLAGPVVGATLMVHAVSSEILTEHLPSFLDKTISFGVKDSKKLTAKKRQQVLEKFDLDPCNLKSGKGQILFKSPYMTIIYSIAEISSQEIDQINILNASLKSMCHSFFFCLKKLAAIKEMTTPSGLLLIDGHKKVNLEFPSIKEETVIKGDSKSLLIGLASILAKEYRDYLMIQFGKTYPGYGLEKHAGYPTTAHKEAVATLGPSPIHRLTFKGVKDANCF